MGGTWYLGAAINLVGSIMINLGTNIMKLGHNRRAALESRVGRKFPVRTFREWQLGVVLFAVGNLANFVSFGYAAQSLLAALGSVQFVSNVLFASLFLKEKVTKGVLVSTACIVLGCIGLVFFGSHESKQFTVDELMQLYHRPVYMAYMLFLAVVVVIMYAVYKIGSRRLSKGGSGSLSTSWYRVLPISYALFSGLLGTQSVLFSKTISILLRVTINGNSQMKSWFMWIIIIAFLCTSTFWVTRLNKALKKFPALIIVPTMQISWTLFSILSGMLYFEEYKGFNVLSGWMFALSVLVVFLGVYLLTKDRRVEHADVDEKYCSGDSQYESSDTMSSGCIKENSPSPDEHEAFKLGEKVQPCMDMDMSRIGFRDVNVSSEDIVESPTELSPMVVTENSHTHMHDFRGSPLGKNMCTSFCSIEAASPDGGDDCVERHPGFHSAPQPRSDRTITLLNEMTGELSMDLWSAFKHPVALEPCSGHVVNIHGPPGLISAENPYNVMPQNQALCTPDEEVCRAG